MSVRLLFSINKNGGKANLDLLLPYQGKAFGHVGLGKFLNASWIFVCT